MRQQARKYRAEAKQYLESGDLVAAGDYYTLSAHERAGHGVPEPPAQVSLGVIADFIHAALYYRMAGYDARGSNRCEMGRLVIEDVLERYETTGYAPDYSYDRARKGVFYELLGYLRVIADQDDADEAFNKALDVYEQTGSLEFHICKGEQHGVLAGVFSSIKRGAGYEVDPQGPEQHPLGLTIADWVVFERKHLPKYVKELLERGEWATESERTPEEID